MSKVLLGACGDISFNGPLSEHIRQKGPGFAFEKVLDCCKRPDILLGNMESVMAPCSSDGARGLYCPDYVAESLKIAGFDILNLANNHILDCGWRGLLHTQKVINDMGIKTIGAGRDSNEARRLQVVEVKGVKIGFLAYQEPCNCTFEGGGGRVSYFSLPGAIEDVIRYKPLVDILVVNFHGDMEFNPSPSLLKVEYCRKLAETGADIVLCHHPHVPQGVELWGNSLIAYSLGNFAFKIDGYMMNGYPNTARSHLLFIEIEDGRITNWFREYFLIDREEGRPYKPGEEKYKEEESYYRYLDSILKDDKKLRDMWHEASLRYFKLYLDIVAKKGPEEFIRHYGFKIFRLMENRHWVDGIKELIDQEYEKNMYNDFEDARPNAPFEGVLHF